jgi:hypothetical protein
MLANHHKEHTMTTTTTTSDATTYDFGWGPIPAHRHPDGGWVADTVEGLLRNACLIGDGSSKHTEATARLCLSTIERAVWDMDSARRTIKTHAAEIARYAEGVAYELDKGLHLHSVGWVETHAEKLTEARRNLEAATETVRYHAVILSTMHTLGSNEDRNEFMHDIINAAMAGRI